MADSSQNEFDIFFGQEKIIRNLQTLIGVCKVNGTVLPHMVFKAPEGMGKITLAKIISNCYGVGLHLSRGQDIIKPCELAAVFSNLRGGDILIIEELQQISINCVELLLSVVEEYAMSIIIGKGQDKREVRLKLPQFAIIGTSSEPWRIPNKIRKSNFIHYEFSNYSENDVLQALTNEAKKVGLNIDPAALDYLIKLSELIPGRAILIFRQIYNFSPARKISVLTYSIAQKAAQYLGIDNENHENYFSSERICKMSGIEFEHFVASVFRKKGYLVTETAASGDHGIDLILQKNGEVELVQCKVRTTGPIGEPIIRDFLGSIINEKVKRGYIITTSKFTNQAIIFSQDKPIILIDINLLIKLSNAS